MSEEAMKQATDLLIAARAAKAEFWHDPAAANRVEAAVIAAAMAADKAEIARLKQSVIAFAGPWAVKWAQDCGLPKDHIHASHYDLLAKCGARMDSFTRAEPALETPHAE